MDKAVGNLQSEYKESPLKKFVLFLVAVLLAASLGSILQSMFNLNAITQLAGPISLSYWLSTICFDLVHFMPVMAAIFVPVLLLSLLATALLRRWFKLSLLATSFGVTALGTWVALSLINQLAPMPTLIALNRSTSGTLLLLCCSGVAMVLFQYLTCKRRHV